MRTQLLQRIGIGVGVLAVSAALIGAGWYGTNSGILPSTADAKIGNGIHQGPQDGTGQQHGVNGTQPHLQQGDMTQQHQGNGQGRGKGQGRGNGQGRGAGNMTQSVDQ